MTRSARLILPRLIFVGLIGAVAFAISACATPFVQSAQIPPASFAGPRIEDAPRSGAEGQFVMTDGARLPFLRWSPEAGSPQRVFVALHGMNDHNASFRLAGPWWAQRGVVTYSFDQRGFGHAPGRSKWAGEGLMTSDLSTVVDLVLARHPGLPVTVVGESMGGSVAIAAFASDKAPKADSLVLLAPGVWGWSSQDQINRLSLRLAAHTLPARSLTPPDFIARRILASDNWLELIRNGRDPDSILSTRVDAIYGLVNLMQTASDRLGQTRVPTLLLYGGKDQVVEPGPMRKALETARDAPNLTTGFYPEAYHLLNRGLTAETVYRDVLAFSQSPSTPVPSGATPILPQLIQE